MLKRPLIYFAMGNSSRLPLEMFGAFGGVRVLESFAYITSTVDRYRSTWQSACLDSGAFAELNGNAAIDLVEYIDFCLQHGAFYDFVTNLDDIKGDVARSTRNLQQMLDAGVPALPVFHQGEPWSVLDECISASGERRFIAIGFRRPINNAKNWLDDVFSRVPSDVRVHGFAMVNYLSYPFFSVDATTWMHEWKALMGSQGQAGEALSYLTPGELLQIASSRSTSASRRGGCGPARSRASFSKRRSPHDDVHV